VLGRSGLAKLDGDASVCGFGELRVSERRSRGIAQEALAAGLVARSDMDVRMDRKAVSLAG